MHVIIKKIIKNRGTDIICSNIFVNCIDDEGGFADVEARPYKKILKNVVQDGYTRKLLDIGKWNAEAELLARSFARKNKLQEEAALYAFSCLAYGLGWLHTYPALSSARQVFASSQQPNISQGSGEKDSQDIVKDAEERAKAAEQRAKEAERVAKEAEEARLRAEEQIRLQNEKKKLIIFLLIAACIGLLIGILVVFLIQRQPQNTAPNPQPTITTTTEKPKQDRTSTPVTPPIVKDKPKTKTNPKQLKLSYGTWESKNGMSPNSINGEGILTYNKSVEITGWPGKITEKGDYIKGRFVNGKPENAYWFSKDVKLKEFLHGSSE
ncbi:MAG: hypothetical protein IJT12_01020 [Paludibacteraceae bacterium]|nr:hypothetical protein [Paludibacteraceae bacterium]